MVFLQEAKAWLILLRWVNILKNTQICIGTFLFRADLLFPTWNIACQVVFAQLHIWNMATPSRLCSHLLPGKGQNLRFKNTPRILPRKKHEVLVMNGDECPSVSYQVCPEEVCNTSHKSSLTWNKEHLAQFRCWPIYECCASFKSVVANFWPFFSAKHHPTFLFIQLCTDLIVWPSLQSLQIHKYVT